MSGLEPLVALILLLASAYGGLAQLLWGRRWRHLLIYWCIAFGSCLLVYALGLRFNTAWPAPGGLPLVEATLVAWLLFVVASQGRL